MTLESLNKTANKKLAEDKYKQQYEKRKVEEFRQEVKKNLDNSSVHRRYKIAEEGKFEYDVYIVNNKLNNKISGTNCNKCDILREIATQTNRFGNHGARLIVENTYGKTTICRDDTKHSKMTNGCVLKYSWTKYDEVMKFKDEIIGGMLKWIGLEKN